MLDANLIVDLLNEKLDKQANLEDAPSVPRKTVLVELPSGEIRTEFGADGLYLVFDADCKDALPYCKAQCCGLKGTVVTGEEASTLSGLTSYNPIDENIEMKRECDGFCIALDRDKRLCSVYEQRPNTCREFHCSRGLQRGWKIPNGISRLPYD